MKSETRTGVQGFAISSLLSTRADFPQDGRTDVDFHRSILAYLDWRLGQGRPYYRAKANPDFISYRDAKFLVNQAWTQPDPRSMHIAGSLDLSTLSARVADWPEEARLAHEAREKAAAGRVAAATERLLNKDKYIKAAKERLKLEKKHKKLGIQTLPKPFRLVPEKEKTA